MKKLNLVVVFCVLVSGISFSQIGLLKGTFGKKKNEAKYVKDNGVVTDLHKKYIKQIVFFSNAKGEELKESDLKTKFTLTDTLRSMIFLEKSLVNHLIDVYPETSSFDLAKRASLVSKWYLDGALILEEGSYIKLSAGNNDVWENENTTSFKRTFYDKNSNSDYSFFEWKDFIKKSQSYLTKGDHKVELKVFVKDEKVADVNKLLEIANGAFNLSINKIVFDPMDPIFCGPTSYANTRDVKTESAMKVAFENLGKGKALGAVFRSYFKENYNQLGALQYRTFSGSIIHKMDDACGYTTFEFKQFFNGDTYTNCQIDSGGNFNAFNCECLK